MYLILTCPSLFGKVEVQTLFLENKMTLTTLSRNFLSFSPIEIAKIRLREILSHENREITYE